MWRVLAFVASWALVWTCVSSQSRNTVASLVSEYEAKGADLKFTFFDITTPQCRILLNGLRLTSLKLATSPSSNKVAESLDADSVTLDARAGDAPCVDGALDFSTLLMSTNDLQNTYFVFLQTLFTKLPEGNAWQGAGPLDGCRTGRRAPFDEITVPEIVLYTPANNETVIGTFSYPVKGLIPPSESNLTTLAEGVLYATVLFDLSELTDADREEVSRVSGDDRELGDNFFCHLANDAEAANKARIEGDPTISSGDTGSPNADDSNPSDGSKERSFSTGEAVGIAGGSIVVLVAICAVAYVSRRRRHRQAQFDASLVTP